MKMERKKEIIVTKNLKRKKWQEGMTEREIELLTKWNAKPYRYQKKKGG